MVLEEKYLNTVLTRVSPHHPQRNRQRADRQRANHQQDNPSTGQFTNETGQYLNGTIRQWVNLNSLGTNTGM